MLFLSFVWLALFIIEVIWGLSLIEQDYRNIKRIVKPDAGLEVFQQC